MTIPMLSVAFAATLRHNRKLFRIDLGSNGIGDPGAVALAVEWGEKN